MDSSISWTDIKNALSQYKFPDSNHDVIIWGAGLLGQTEMPLLKDDLRVAAFCDSSREKQQSGVLGVPCISPEQIGGYKNPFVLISSIKNYSDIAQKLENADVKYCTVDAYVIYKNAEKFFSVYTLLDEASKNIYAKILWLRLHGDLTHVSEVCEDFQYFALPQFRFCEADEIFVDCGAFVGDVVQRFIENNMSLFRKIYAFEINPAAFEKMKHRIRRLQDVWIFQEGQIICEQKGVGKKSFKSSLCINDLNAANCYLRGIMSPPPRTIIFVQRTVCFRRWGNHRDCISRSIF